MKSSLKQKLRKHELAIGSWITIGHPTVAELMARSGFDWLAIDMEHSSLSVSECGELIRTIDLCGVAPLVRVGANDPLLIKRAMDSGAHGVIVPMINSAQEGYRGVCLARAQGYGRDFEAYKKWVPENAVVVVQIEHIKAVENIDAILAVEGIDAIIIGPYDLSGSLGKPGDFKDPALINAMSKVQKKAAARGIPPGMHVVSSDEKLLAQRIKEGYTFIAYGVDFLFIQETCVKGLTSARK